MICLNLCSSLIYLYTYVLEFICMDEILSLNLLCLLNFYFSNFQVDDLLQIVLVLVDNCLILWLLEKFCSSLVLDMALAGSGYMGWRDAIKLLLAGMKISQVCCLWGSHMHLIPSFTDVYFVFALHLVPERYLLRAYPPEFHFHQWSYFFFYPPLSRNVLILIATRNASSLKLLALIGSTDNFRFI